MRVAGEGVCEGAACECWAYASVAEARAKVTPARLAAFEILMLVGQGKGHSDELLHSGLDGGACRLRTGIWRRRW